MNFKNEKGVTLMALIVTIVVMSILASIAISASVGNNGLINETREGTYKASIREVEEAIEVRLILKEKEKNKKGDYTNTTISVLTGEDTLEDESDNILIHELTTATHNIYKVDISKLDTKGKYGKGTDNDIFKVEVLLDSNGNETDNFEVIYIP